ncbi:MAG: hypothetical protein O3A55_00390 [Bacteroidetes bacterium]|nr:hypothetical protein [Bacteroidota bacterium]
MKLFDKIFSRDEFRINPPVLLDIGASSKINPKWKKIAKYSICIAFDADDRDFNLPTDKNNIFKKIHLLNSVVTVGDLIETDFYLTKSPYCSSILKPNQNELSSWSFSDKFEIEKVVKIKTTNLQNVLSNLNIDNVDWFKTDSQGIDLQLFRSLPTQILQKVIVAEFEPGIINAYLGEDKFYDILKFMEEKNFLLADARIKGSQFLSNKLLSEITSNTSHIKVLQFSHKIMPGWVEVLFFNKFLNNNFSIREYLLCWVFATIQKQYGFAFQVAKDGKSKFDDSIFNELISSSINSIKLNIFNFKFIGAIFDKMLKSLKLK